MLFVRLIMLLVSFLLVVGGLLYINFDKKVLETFIVGFITSSIIILASFKSYKNMVESRLESNLENIEFNDRDEIDKIDDPYELYSEDEVDSNLSASELIKEEKKRLKRDKLGFKESFKNSLRAFSFLRVSAYFIFILGFFYLLKSGNLSIICYFVTIILPNLIVILYLLNFNNIRGR